MLSTRRSRALQRSVDHFPWHALPRELKLHVLRHLLPECEYDETVSRSTKDSRKQLQSVTSLLCIDRETFNTLAPTAYSQRIVVFCNPLHLANGLLDRCSAAFLTNLRYLIFHLEYPSQDTEAHLEKMLKVLSVSQELRSTLHCLTILYKFPFQTSYTRSICQTGLIENDDLLSKEMQRHLLVYTEAAAHAPTEGGWDVSKRFACLDAMYTTCGDRWDAIDRQSGEVFRRFLRRFRPRAFSIERRLEFTPHQHNGTPDMGLVGAIYLTYRKQSHHAPPQLLDRSTPMSLVWRGRSNYRFATSRYR